MAGEDGSWGSICSFGVLIFGFLFRREGSFRVLDLLVVFLSFSFVCMHRVQMPIFVKNSLRS